MRKILALCDYQNRFGSKYYDQPYRSGMGKDLLKEAFAEYQIDVEFCSMKDEYLLDKGKGASIIYTSQEDAGYHYKGFIEDVILGLELSGANLIPPYKYLRANNNKVFMEMLRQIYLPEKFQLRSKWYGTAEEALKDKAQYGFPVVIKASEGAGSHGVSLAINENELKGKVQKVSRSKHTLAEIRDIIRSLRHHGYTRESVHRKKFILQEYIVQLANDWKVLVFGEKYYVLRRRNRQGDFRASGSGLFSFDDTVAPELLNAAKEIKEAFDVPIISLDLALSGARVILIEFQFVYFGVSTLEKSPYYYIQDNGGWKQVHTKSVIEVEYANSISSFLSSSF